MPALSDPFREVVVEVTVVGITGHAGVGKSTVSRIIRELRPDYVELSFAQPIKDALLALNPEVDGVHLSHRLSELGGWDEAKRHFPEVRRLLQQFGTEVGREMWSPAFWTLKLITQLDHDAKAIVPDVRFLNEAQELRAWGRYFEQPVYIWRVQNPRVFSKSEHASETEQGLIQADNFVMNIGSIEQLYSQVSRMVETHGL